MPAIWYLEQAARGYLAREQWIHGLVQRVNIEAPEFPFSNFLQNDFRRDILLYLFSRPTFRLIETFELIGLIRFYNWFIARYIRVDCSIFIVQREFFEQNYFNKFYGSIMLKVYIFITTSWFKEN